MPGDGQDYTLTSLKRKLYSWLIGLTQDNSDSFNESLQQTKQMTPDTKDIVNLLRSTGFRMVDMKVEKSSSHPSLNSLVCRVVVKCAKSGISVTLESDGECRCPDEAHADNASAWCVLTPNNNQDSLNKSGSVAGSSLLPELPGPVSELVGSATRCVLRLLEDGEGLTPSRGRPSLGSSGGRSRASLRRSASGVPGDPSRLLGAPPPHHRSLDDMQWEASGTSGVGSPATPRPVRALSDASFSASPALTHARSVGQLVPGTPGTTGAGASNIFSADSSGTSGTPAATTGTTTAASAAADTSASMDSAGAGHVAPPRRQSTTLEDYHAFKKPLCNDVEISVESSESAPSVDFPVVQNEVHTPKDAKINQENPAPLPRNEAKKVLKKAEGAIQNMSEVMEMLKKWMISGEGASSEESPAKAGVAKKPTRVHTLPRSSIPMTARRSRAAGAGAGDSKKPAVASAGASRSPSASSVGSAGSRASSTASARAGSSTRTLQVPAKTFKSSPAGAAEASGSSKLPARSGVVAAVRRRSLDDAGAPKTPRTPLTRRPRAVASPYVATAGTFGLATRSPRPCPGPGPALGPGPGPSPRVRAAPPPPKRSSMD